jgi:hypothetical protein
VGSGIFNLVIGGLLIAGAMGVFGQRYTLIGTSSWEALAGLGVIIAGLGAYQIWKHTRRE